MFKKIRKVRRRKEIENIKRRIENIEKEAKKSKFKEYIVYIYYVLPNSLRKKIKEEATYANIEEEDYYYSVVFIISFLSSLVFPLYLVYIKINVLYVLAIFFILFVMSLFVPYFSLTMASESRRKMMEKYLPDFLILTSSNIKSGLTIDRALLFASRKEFGELSKITKKTAYQIYSGKDVDDALIEMSKRIKSQIFNKTIKLLVQGLRSGGNSAKLLEEAANDIRNTEILQKEIRGTVITYIMFIFFAGVVAAPALFATSVFLISSTTTMWKIDDTMQSMLQEYGVMSFISMKKPQIDIAKFELFALVSLMITTVFAGILISVIQSGTYKNAIKYSPFFMVLSIAIYYGVSLGLRNLFGSMLI